MLKQPLDVELPNFPRFFWSFAQSGDIMAHDATLTRIIQFVLTDLCSKCHRYAYYQAKYERMYWIDRVVPILHCFGDRSQFLGFQWCEVPTDEHVEFTIDPN
ncbi:hypothetical protein [Parasitella parasitica]|uniref:Uncharacterized protein n=1 Tax=Parasitella parasitica TaxID=35722 RepID=A0A0B7MW93_9FUNG|nr:hypothetical protein [Parasitella parasitica]